MSIAWAQPWAGAISAVHLPAELWRPSDTGDADPGAALIFNNNFGAPNYDRIDGWSMLHPLGVKVSKENHLDTEILMPDWIEGYTPSIVQIGIEFNFVTSGDAQAFTINMFCGCKFAPGTGPLNGFAWNNISARGSGPMPFYNMVKGPYSFNVGGVSPNTVLRLRVGRRYDDGGGTLETWLYEVFFLGATIYYKIA